MKLKVLFLPKSFAKFWHGIIDRLQNLISALRWQLPFYTSTFKIARKNTEEAIFLLSINLRAYLYIHGWELHIANMKFYKKDKEYCISSCHFVWRTCQGCHLGLAKRIFWTTCRKYQHTVRRLQPIKKVHMHVELTRKMQDV